MAITSKTRGFALLTAVIIMSLMLTFGLSIGSLAYKQLILSSGAVASQYAFYAADSVLECGLYADQQQGTFTYPDVNPGAAPVNFTCEGNAPLVGQTEVLWSGPPDSKWRLKYRFSIDSGKHCGDLIVYKPAAGTGPTTIYAQGYDTSCTTVNNCDTGTCNARVTSRGLYNQL